MMSRPESHDVQFPQEKVAAQPSGEGSVDRCWPTLELEKARCVWCGEGTMPVS